MDLYTLLRIARILHFWVKHLDFMEKELEFFEEYETMFGEFRTFTGLIYNFFFDFHERTFSETFIVRPFGVQSHRYIL